MNMALEENTTHAQSNLKEFEGPSYKHREACKWHLAEQATLE